MDPYEHLLEISIAFFSIYYFHLQLKRKMVLRIAQIRYLPLISSVISPSPSLPLFFDPFNVIILINQIFPNSLWCDSCVNKNYHQFMNVPVLLEVFGKESFFSHQFCTELFLIDYYLLCSSQFVANLANCSLLFQYTVFLLQMVDI